MNGNRSSHEHLGTKGRRRRGWVGHHLHLLRGERFFQNYRNPRSTFQQLTNFIPPRVVFGIVILVTDKTRILWFTFGSFLGWRFRGVLSGLLRFILCFPFLFPFRGFICRGGLNDIDLGSISRIRYTLRSLFV